MWILGSAGHFGEALMRTLPAAGHEVIGADLKPSPFTVHVGSVIDRTFARTCLQGIEAAVHTATVHKPHVATHTRQAFVDTNITGTLNLLEESIASGVDVFVSTSTTSAFGHALVPAVGALSAWITEDVSPVPKNIYGVTKVAAENLCELFHRRFRLPCLILRTSRFFAEADDRRETREAFADLNIKANEFLYRRNDLQDIVDAHVLGLTAARDIGFGRCILSATTPFSPADLPELKENAANVVGRLFPGYGELYARRGWVMFPSIERVYVNGRARRELGWRPQYDFAHILG